MSSGVARTARGSLTGTGANIDVKNLGFRPKYVKLLNVSGACQAEWSSSMADASMAKIVDSGVNTTDLSFVTSLGVTPLADGFRLGADTDLNVSGETVHWVAFE